jgi:hypothetical protein
LCRHNHTMKQNGGQEGEFKQLMEESAQAEEIVNRV